MWGCFSCMYMFTMYMLGAWKGKKEVSDNVGIGVIDGCEPLNPDSGPLQEQQGLFMLCHLYSP